MSEHSNETPKSLAIAERGIANSQQAIGFLSALIADGSAGRVTPGAMHAVCNAMGKMLHVVELEMRHGTAVGSGPTKVLDFIPAKAVAEGPSIRDMAIGKLTAVERRSLGLE